MCAVCEQFIVERWPCFEKLPAFRKDVGKDSDALFRIACRLSSALEKVPISVRRYPPEDEYQASFKKAKVESS